MRLAARGLLYLDSNSDRGGLMTTKWTAWCFAVFALLATTGCSAEDTEDTNAGEEVGVDSTEQELGATGAGLNCAGGGRVFRTIYGRAQWCVNVDNAGRGTIGWNNLDAKRFIAQTASAGVCTVGGSNPVVQYSSRGRGIKIGRGGSCLAPAVEFSGGSAAKAGYWTGGAFVAATGVIPFY
jgi:hypothetical protein